MFAEREARLSVQRELTGLFEDVETFGTAFNVYGEAELRDEAHVTSRPFVFILDTFTLFQAEHLPVIVIETAFQAIPLELGNDPALVCNCNLHVFGRHAGERDDLAGAIRKNIKNIHIRDFDAADEPVLLTSPLIPIGRARGEELYWQLTPSPPSSEELILEATLLNWLIASCSFYAEL